MFLRRIDFGISDGVIIEAVDDALQETWGEDLTVDIERPVPATRRMVIFRNDSGPTSLVTAFRRYGCNVHAESRLQAEKLANAAIAAVRTIHSLPVSWTDSFSGPRWIEPTEDEPQIVVDGQLLSEYYFTFRAGVRGREPLT